MAIRAAYAPGYTDGTIQQPCDLLLLPSIEGAGRCNRRTPSHEMPVDASPGDFESALKPLWLRAQSGDDMAYRQALGLLATRLRGYLKRRLSG